jgi:hypothetical protein
MNERDHTAMELAVTAAVTVVAIIGYFASVWWEHLGWLVN